MNTHKWVMRVPVLSTLHVPGPEALLDMQKQFMSAPSNEGDFVLVYLGPYAGEGAPAWRDALSEWVFRNYEDYWIRFDPDGDIVDELPCFPTNWP